MLVFEWDPLQYNLPFQGDSQQKEVEVVVDSNQWSFHGYSGHIF